jgi:hypothetical protein
MSGTVTNHNDDRSLEDLDDEDDRDELRQRYYGLVQELRVILPGVQIFVAFLLTAPFNDRFGDIDDFGRALYGIALGAGVLAVVVLVTPAALHRVGDRRSRVHRLRLSIRLARVGFVLFGIALLSALTLIVRHLFGTALSTITVAMVAVAMAGLWVVLPRHVLPDRAERRDDQPR